MRVSSEKQGLTCTGETVGKKIELKVIIKNMQKLPEASDGKGRDACAKKRNRPD